MPTPDKIIEEVSPYYKKRAALAKQKAMLSTASQEYKLSYDSSSETLEPVYFWILDFANPMFGGKIEKLVDNFVSSPGSGHFSELMGKATRMQEEAMKIYGMVNTVIKSIQNLIYDLQEFKLRLKQYEETRSKDKSAAMGGLIGLKQIWMDQVDIKKGTGSINMLARDLNFITIRDAFMAADSKADVEAMDLNERVKRILTARIQEFLEWKDRSEAELKKRYEIEKTYLRTQVDTVKMYSRWAKPYLIAAEQLRMKEESRYTPDVINVFNTIYLQLTLLGKNELDVKNEAANKNLPEEFKHMKVKRPFYSCVLIDFTFRGIPKSVGQHYAFGGKADVAFRAYALNEDEYKLFRYKLEKSDFSDAMNLVSGMTKESLDQLNADIEKFLGEKDAEAKAKAEREEVNPFKALLGMSEKKAEKEGKKEETPEEKAKKEAEAIEKKGVSADTHAESLMRSLAEFYARKTCFTIYDVYKKAHGMASQPFGDVMSVRDIKIPFLDIFKR